MSSAEFPLILVTGGARSGKSSFAERLAMDAPAPRWYIATCPRLDDEMERRIRLHQARRAAQDWHTIEEEIDLESALRRASASGAATILVDCLTLWINNLLYRQSDFDEAAMAIRAESLLSVLSQLPCTVILVINEVGLGLVPDSPSGRIFRDCSGRCAQIIARGADAVYLTVAGIPLTVKKSF